MYDISGLSYHPSTNMDWFTKAIFGGRLIEKGKITPVIGVKNSTQLNLIDLASNLLQADKSNCDWSPEQIVKLSEKELKVKTYKINLEQCIDELESKRIAWMLSPGARNQELADTLEDATMALLASELSSEIERKIFTADSAKNADDFDGVLKVLSTSTEAKKVAGASITKENVLAEIEKVFAALPIDVVAKGIEEGTLNIYTSYATMLKAKMALGGVYGQNVVVSPNYTVEGEVIRYMGVEIVPVKGLSDNEMVAADAKNFILGTDLVSDLEEIRLGQMAAPMDNKIFIDGRLRLGFAIAFEDEVVYYKKA